MLIAKFPSVYLVLLALLISVGMKLHVLPSEIQGKHAWRQSMTALNIRNFSRYDANILNPRVAHFNDGDSNIKRLEFPLLQWSIAMVQRIIGEKILYTRSLLLLLSFFSLWGMYKLCLLLFMSEFWAATGMWILSFSPVFYYHSINPLPDNLALCLSIWFLFHFFNYIRKKQSSSIYASAVFLGTAALCKLPFILFGIIPLVYLIQKLNIKNKDRQFPFVTYLLAYGLSVLAVFLWYAWVIPGWKELHLTKGILDDSISFSGYLNFLSIQLKNTIPTVVLNYASCVLVILSVFFMIAKKKLSDPRVQLLAFAVSVFILYFFFVLKQIQDGHDYYHYPFVPLFTILCVFTLKELLNKRKTGTYLYILFMAAMPILCLVKVDPYWDIELSYTNLDFLEYRTEMRNIVPKDAKCIMVNDPSFCIVPYAIDKQGYIFANDHLPIEWIRDLIRRDKADYMYSDSRRIESQAGFSDCVQDTLAKYGTVHIYKLKSSLE